MTEAPERSSLGPLASGVGAALGHFDSVRLGERLAAADSTLWSEDPAVGARVENRLGWIGSRLSSPLGGVPAAEGRVLLLGMGGSSLGAEACTRAFGMDDRLKILDSTLPAAVAAVEEWLPEVSDVVVASKSGGTLETMALADHFEARCSSGVHFHAVTDPGSELEARAQARGYASCHLNAPDIGGRFSVLSLFGSVPLDLAGLDVGGIRLRAAVMARRCAAATAKDNPGLWLGAVLAAAATEGRNKLVIRAAPGLDGLADWIEQLVAESTGKDGMGLVPVTHATANVEMDGASDRTVVCLEWRESTSRHERQVAELLEAGVPVVRLVLRERQDIGAEFYRWQIAVAAVGAALGINPFDEPDVASAKRRTGEVLQAAQKDGGLPSPAVAYRGGQVDLFAPGEVGTARELLAPIVASVPEGYLGVLAFLPRTPTVEAGLAEVREALGGPNPVTLGWGPRYLHSSGQLHKGGPPIGRFLMLTAEDDVDVEIPGSPWTFGVLARAQALGDALALAQKGRPVVRAHLRGSLPPSMAELVRLLKQAR